MIPMDEIFSDDQFNCRGQISPFEVQALAEDIAKNGLDQPIMVQPWDASPGKKYMILAGHRRFLACKINKQTTIAAFVRYNLTEAAARSINIRENVSRKDLNIMQEARGLLWFKLKGWDEQRTADHLSQSRGWVQIRYMLLELPTDIQKECAAGLINQAQIRKLYSLRGKTDELYALVRLIKEAKERGEKVDLTPSKTSNPLTKRPRSKEEIFKMIDFLFQSVGMGFHTRCLAWASGEINTYELYLDIKEFAFDLGVDFEIPREMVESVGQQFIDTFVGKQ